MALTIYCDESCQNRHRFMALGGIVIPSSNTYIVYEALQDFRAKHRMHAEMKWTKVSNAKLPQYMTLTDYFFSLNNTDRAHFHCLFLDTHLLDHTRFNKGDRELGFYKFYYQLLLHSFGRRYPGEEFYVYLDHRRTGYSLNTLRDVLNNGMRVRYGDNSRPFRLIEYKNSKQEDMLQVADVLLGALSSRKNGRHLIPGARQAKTALSAHIITTAGLADSLPSTPRSRHRFTVWNFRLS